MLETFIKLATYLSEAGTITYATMNASTGYLTIDGCSDDGKSFHLSYKEEEGQPHADP